MSIRIALLLMCSMLAVCAADAPYACKVGDKVEGLNVDWYAGTVTEIGSANYNGYCFLKWDKFSSGQWINAKYIRAPKGAPGNADAPTSATPPIAKYLCGVFLNNQFTLTQTVTLKRDGAYDMSVGGSGRFRYDAASKRILFDGGPLKDLFGKYEADNHQLFRLTMKEDAAKSPAAQNWRSQVCSPQK